MISAIQRISALMACSVKFE